MKVSTIVSILALAAPMMIVTAKPERKRVFKIYTQDEIQAFEDNDYDGERMLQKDDKPDQKPPKDQKPDEIEAPAEASMSMSMEMTSAPSVSAVESSAPTVDAGTDAPAVTDPPVAAILDTPAPTEPPVVITPAPTEPTMTKPPTGTFTFKPTAAQGSATEPPNPFAAGSAPDAPTSSAITVGTTLAAAAIALFVIIA